MSLALARPAQADDIVLGVVVKQFQQLTATVAASTQSMDRTSETMLAELQKVSSAFEVFKKEIRTTLREFTEENMTLREALAASEKRNTDNIAIQQAKDKETTATLDAQNKVIAAIRQEITDLKAQQVEDRRCYTAGDVALAERITRVLVAAGLPSC